MAPPRKLALRGYLICYHLDQYAPQEETHDTSMRGTMADIIQLADALRTMYTIISSDSYTATISIVGLLMIILSVLIAAKSSGESQKLPNSLRAVLFISLFSGLLFSAAGAAIPLLDLTHRAKHRIMSPQEAMEHLRTNDKVLWLIRLIPYDLIKEPQLSIANLSTLGKPAQRYVFVADYQELRGHTVADAVRMAGGELAHGNRVSAIIFPVEMVVYPANARGLLQVIRKVENENPASPASLFNVDENLKAFDESKSELRDINKDSINSWSWDSYHEYYKDYCKVAQQFRCSNYSDYTARSLIGDISYDWSPLGFAANALPEKSPCDEDVREKICDISDWSEAERTVSPIFGARAFLVDNIKISSLNGRYMIDFGEPDTQYIPDLFP